MHYLQTEHKIATPEARKQLQKFLEEDHKRLERAEQARKALLSVRK